MRTRLTKADRGWRWTLFAGVFLASLGWIVSANLGRSQAAAPVAGQGQVVQPQAQQEKQVANAKPADLPLPSTEATKQQLIEDTDRLYQLATELKSEVDKTNRNTLSVQVIKKADEIEKLARSIHDRTKPN
jgi:hypothetical protein